MDEKNWLNVKEIFLAALEKNEKSRSEYLDEICADNSDLREEIESLLASHEEIEDFIEKPVFQVGEVFTNGANHTEKHFGNYKIIREIGAGGMGAVFLAQRSDGEFDQQVAIKIIRQAIAEAEIINRFKRERQILASLNHPNIAKLLDGGVSADGLPFLAMEYVEGDAITKFANGENSNLEERLKLFLKVCAAVSYAHRNLIVHRDLKPSNILVTKDGEPKLLDFGLAKLLDENLSNDVTQTQTAFRALTPAYASPEQLRGETLTTASDIYSLGVILYELLTGERPFQFEGKSLDEIIKTVTAATPLPPSANPKSKIQNPKSLKGDLDNIALMALRKEPERRYKSVEAFADDIERYLKELPVAARSNTAKYRASKFIKRHKVGVVAASLILVSLVGGVISTIWQANRAETQKQKAEKRFGEVRKIAGSFIFEISPKIENLAGAMEAREILVKRALEYLDNLQNESSDDRELQRELAAAYEKVGDIQGRLNQPSLGDTKAALESYGKAQKLRESVLSADAANSEKQSELANDYEQIGYLLWWSSDTKKAVELYQKSLLMREKLVGENPLSNDFRQRLAKLQMQYGDIYAWDKEIEKALSHYRPALEILEKLAAEMPGDPAVKGDLARCYARLSDVYITADELDKALLETEKSLVIYEPLVAAAPTDLKQRRGMWIAYFRQCQIYLGKKDLAKASASCGKILEMAESDFKADPQNETAQHSRAIGFYHLGELLMLEKKFPEAQKNYEKSLAIVTEKAAEADDKSEYQRDMALDYTAIGKLQMENGQFPSALENQLKAQKLLEEILGNDAENTAPQIDLAKVHQQIGKIKLRQKDLAQADAEFNEALKILRQLDEQNALNNLDKKILAELVSDMQKNR
jgi:non-specific serine/threonine protein kinase/serine/threonine-protein kinase